MMKLGSKAVTSAALAVEVPAKKFEAVGESSDPEGRDHMLVEIRVAQ